MLAAQQFALGDTIIHWQFWRPLKVLKDSMGEKEKT